MYMKKVGNSLKATTVVNKANRNFWIGNIIATSAFLLILLLCPVGNGLTEVGVRVLAVFAWSVLLWMLGNCVYGTIGALCLLPLLGVSTSDVLANTVFGHSSVTIMLFFALTTHVLKNCGILDIWVRWLLSRNLFVKRPYLFLVTFAYIVMLVGSLFSQIITSFVFCSFAIEFCKTLGYKRTDKFYLSLICVVLWISSVGESIIPLGKGLGMITIATMSGLGLTFDLATHCKISIPFALLYPLLILAVIRFFIRPDVSRYITYNTSNLRESLNSQKITKKMKLVIISYLLMLIIWILPNLSVCPTALKSILDKCGMLCPPMLLCMFYSVARFDGKPLLNIENDWDKVPWHAAVFAGGIATFSSLLSSDQIGISLWLKTIFSNTTLVSSDYAPMVILAVFITIVLTQFTSNGVICSTVGTIMYTIILTIHPGLNSSFFSVLMLSCGTAFLTPAASPLVPYIIGDNGFVSVKEVLRPNLIMMVLAGALISVLSLVLM